MPNRKKSYGFMRHNLLHSKTTKRNATTSPQSRWGLRGPISQIFNAPEQYIQTPKLKSQT